MQLVRSGQVKNRYFGTITIIQAKLMVKMVRLLEWMED